jgi:hypothetical protein
MRGNLVLPNATKGKHNYGQPRVGMAKGKYDQRQGRCAQGQGKTKWGKGKGKGKEKNIR